MARKLKTNNGKYNMGLLDFFKNQPQMADPHANARRLMGGAVQAQPMAQPAVQPQSLLPQGTPQEPSMTPYQQPQNIGSGVMGYDRDLTGINNVGMQNTNEEAVNLGQTYDSLGWKDDNSNTYSDGQVLQGQGNNSGYIPIDNTGVNYAFQAPEEAGGSDGKAGVTVKPADIPLSVITGDTKYNIPTQTPESLLGTGGNFGVVNEDEERIKKLLEADNRRGLWQRFTDRGRDILGGKY